MPAENRTNRPGPRSRELFQRESRFMAPGLQSIALFSEIVIEKARGVRLTDVDGNRYIDFTAGIGVGSVGHCHPHYVKTMTEQIETACFGSFCTENRLAFLETLASITPAGIDSIQLYSSGAEAVEAALRLAKSVTGNFEFAGFWGGFHGKTGGVLGLLGDTGFKAQLGPLMPGLYLAGPYAYCYRCRWNLTHPGCGLACVEWFREALRHQTSHRLAGILVEPVQGTAGNVPPPEGFMAAVQEVAREFGALLIADEMITGFGRTGTMWGVDHDGVAPDVMTLGKGIGGGFPMSAVAASPEAVAAKPFGNPSGSSSSYGGNPLAAAAGRAALEIILGENLAQNARRVGDLMLETLKDFQQECTLIGDVRGRGLMIGVELVGDRRSKTPLAKKFTRALFHECLDRGLVSMCYTSNIRINPPLVITAEEAAEGLEILKESLRVIEARVKKEGAS
jgi:4-aminobutyrate aminotransferase-like enzyme